MASGDRLNGCGPPLATYVNSATVTRPLMSSSPTIFISYASPDRTRAEALHARLEAAGLEA